MPMSEHAHIVMVRSNIQRDHENAWINLLFRFHSETEEGKSCGIWGKRKNKNVFCTKPKT